MNSADHVQTIQRAVKTLTAWKKLGSMAAMKQRITSVALVFCFLASAALAAGPEMGTWKLNEKKSKYTAGSAMNTKVVYEESGDKVKVTVWSVAQNGRRWSSEWVGKFDGKDYAVTGDPFSDTRSMKKAGNRTFKLVSKKDSKVTATGKVVYAADGKTRTVTTQGRGPDGKPTRASQFYDKE
jgi:hypothetical protein